MPHSNRRAVVVVDDLFFAARILSGLRKLGFETTSAATVDEAAARAASKADLAIVCLGSRGLDGLAAVRRLKEHGARRIIGFISHTSIPSVRDEARAAGADIVCANSAIVQRLPDIVERTIGESGVGRGSSMSGHEPSA